MEAEVEARTGAGHGLRDPPRQVQRNGYRERAWDTRAGRIDLLRRDPPATKGSRLLFLEPRRTAERRLRHGQDLPTRGSIPTRAPSVMILDDRPADDVWKHIIPTVTYRIVMPASSRHAYSPVRQPGFIRPEPSQAGGLVLVASHRRLG